ncbi:MAG TPA: winged helix-turn-helix domain-containing protein [Vicinamibacterales bacterium]|nr:winged helix-turn-helix domain-containing protein [Vicinamibacterales bacterium]
MRDILPPATVAFHGATTHRAVRFGPFRFDWLDKILTREGTEVRLPPRAHGILAYLLERPGRVVSKQELIDAVWKDAFVSESSLTEAIGVLRQALGDSASGAEYIQTVHRRGYRFVAALSIEAQSAGAGATAVAPTLVVAPDRQAPRSRVAAVSIAAAVVLAVGALIYWMLPRADTTPAVTRATITLPVTQAPAPGLTAQPVAELSPDGRRIIYVAGAPGSYRLFLRAIDQFDAIPVPGTDGAHAPFFSPDGASIGFFARGRLMVMTLPDGQPIDLADAGGGQGGWWHTDGTITFATGSQEGVFRISATGGERRPIAIVGLDGATVRHPTLTRDGQTLLATAWKFNVRHSEVVAVDMTSGAVRTIARGVHPRALDDQRVVYLRDGDLVAAPLDGSGPETSLISAVMTGVTGAGQYSLAANGTLLYLPDSPTRLLRRLVRISPKGVEEPLLFEPRAFQNLAISPDGRRLAVSIYDRGASDIWAGEIDRGILQRMTTDGGNVDPVWSHDGTSILFATAQPGATRVYRMPADGTAPPMLVSSVTSLSPSSVTADSRVFAARLGPGGGADILVIEPDGTTRDWLATAANESSPRVSPDNRFVAYRSNRSGRFEIYVRAISGAGPDHQVSVNGGTRPDWSGDSRAIFFVGPDRGILRATWHEGAAGRPQPVSGGADLVWSRVGASGVIGFTAIEEERPLTTLNLVVGWTREVSRAR